VVNPAFGRTLREFRKQTKVSQKELAREVGINASMISRYENVESRPKPRVLQEIINALARHQLPRDKLDRLWELADLHPPGTEISTPAHPILSYLTRVLESSTASEYEEKLFEDIRSAVENRQGSNSARAILAQKEWAPAAKQLLHLGEQEGIRHQQTVLEISKMLGWAIYGQGNHESAAQEYERALLAARHLEVHQRGEDAKTAARAAQAQLLVRSGDTYRRLARWGVAEPRYKEAEELYRALGDSLQVADCLRRIAAIYIRQGKAEDALDLCDESLAIYQQEQYDRGVYKGLQHKAWALELLGDWDEAAKLAKDALDIVDRIASDDEAELAKAYGYLADKRLLQGKLMRDRLDEAEQLYSDAKKILEGKSAAKLISGQFLLGLGRVYLEQGDLLRAQRYLNDSLEQYIELRQPYEEAYAQSLLGQLLVQQRRPDLAEARFQFAANRFEDSHSYYNLAEVWASLAELAYEQEQMGVVYEKVHAIAALGNRPFRVFTARVRFVEGKALMSERRYPEAYQAFCQASEQALAFNHYVFGEIRKRLLGQIDELGRSGERGTAASLCDAYLAFWRQEDVKDMQADKRELVRSSLEDVRQRRDEIAVLKRVD
jgi:tetratricopeptide (TPR) repeat protein